MLIFLTDVYTIVQYLVENQKEVFEGVEEERGLFRQKVQAEYKEKQVTQIEHRAEERKKIKERRRLEEREREGMYEIINENEIEKGMASFARKK